MSVMNGHPHLRTEEETTLTYSDVNVSGMADTVLKALGISVDDNRAVETAKFKAMEISHGAGYNIADPVVALKVAVDIIGQQK